MLRASVFDQKIRFDLKLFDPNLLLYDREPIRYTRRRYPRSRRGRTMHINHDFHHVELEATARHREFCARDQVFFRVWHGRVTPKGNVHARAPAVVGRYRLKCFVVSF